MLGGIDEDMHNPDGNKTEILTSIIKNNINLKDELGMTVQKSTQTIFVGIQWNLSINIITAFRIKDTSIKQTAIDGPIVNHRNIYLRDF